jgi:hypothetical protein
MEVAITITDEGDAIFLHSESAAAFLDMGDVAEHRRASHVEPENIILRNLFHILREKFGEYGWVASFTRLWPCLWRVNTAPVGGPILPGRWRSRSAAIAAEIAFLNDWFLHHE